MRYRGGVLVPYVRNEMTEIVAIALYLASVRTALDRARRQLQIQAWQLRQIVPTEAAVHDASR